MIAPGMRLESGERQGYSVALESVWSGLAHTLARLESVAAEPEARLADVDGVVTARTLQYALHTAAELVLGIDPPPGSEHAHHELAQALVEARDATAEVLDEADLVGVEAVQPLVYEWRGALFRVRLARLRLAASPLPPLSVEPAEEPPARARAWAATLLALAGAAAVVAGAQLGLWPLWSAGFGSLLLSIPTYGI